MPRLTIGLKLVLGLAGLLLCIAVMTLLFGSTEDCDRLCGLVVRVSGYRYRGPGFDPRHYQIF